MLTTNKTITLTLNEDTVNEIVKNNPHCKGYMYDSLMYRYIRAREAMARLEIREKQISPDSAFHVMQRDILKFGEILDEAMGEHD